MNEMDLKPPYLLFLGDAANDLDAKTALGLVHWRPEDCVGQLRYANCRVDTGLPDMDIGQARRAGARSLLIGVAPTGGALAPDWEITLAHALDAGLDVISGMHTPLASLPRLANAAYRSASRLIDIRRPPENLPIASGKKRRGLRLLTVGTDCCVGKKFTALALHQALRQRGVPADFRATGQTGIMIAGGGIPMDAIKADFLAGAAECLTPDQADDHWDIVEGQGSLFHPAYAAVTLGLLHGTQADALVLCHAVGRRQIDEYPDYQIPPLEACLEHYLAAARLTHPAARFVGVSLNTGDRPASARAALLQDVTARTGLPCVDPLALGVDPLAEILADWLR